MIIFAVCADDQNCHLTTICAQRGTQIITNIICCYHAKLRSSVDLKIIIKVIFSSFSKSSLLFSPCGNKKASTKNAFVYSKTQENHVFAICMVRRVLILCLHLSSQTSAFLLPAYNTFKCLRAKDFAEARFLLMYWIVFGLIYVCESTLFGIILESFDLPMYWEAKFCFILWLQLPQTRGAELLYEVFVEPLLKKHEQAIDEKYEEAKASLANSAKQAMNKAATQVMDTIVKQQLKEPLTQ